MPHVITFHYTLTDKSGKVIDSSRPGDPMAFLTGSGHIIPGLEVALLKLAIGDKKVINVPSPEAYGAYDQALIYRIARSKFRDERVKIGDMFEIEMNNTQRVVTVVEVTETEVVLDANHPLAGQDLTFDVELMQTRPATQDEVDHGHAHGSGGHAH